MKIMCCIAAGMLMLSSQASANGNLHSLIVELENIKGLVALQKAKSNEDDERWKFSYDLLESRLDNIIIDIEKHIALKQTLPRLDVVEIAQPVNSIRRSAPKGG